MKVNRSSKCSLKFANPKKRLLLKRILDEYGRVVNYYIDKFWGDPPHKNAIYKELVTCNTWFTVRLNRLAAREAVAIIRSQKSRWGDSAVKPKHRGKTMRVDGAIAAVRLSERASAFDAWLQMRCIGEELKVDLPLKFHRHFNLLDETGKLLNSFVISLNWVQFVFDVPVPEAKQDGRLLGVDTGIRVLASLSDGRQLGTDIRMLMETILRCPRGSKRRTRLMRSLKQRVDEVVQEIVTEDVCLVAVEDLRGLQKRMKRHAKSMRKFAGVWVYRYWLDRLRLACERKRCSFHAVPPQMTSQRCSKCGHTEKGNRSGERFLCKMCGYVDNADVNAARNILDRCLTGSYGTSSKPESEDVMPVASER